MSTPRPAEAGRPTPGSMKVAVPLRLENRRHTAAALLALAAAAVLPQRLLAQPAPRLQRIGVLVLAASASISRFTDELRATLREMGYIEGRHVAYEVLSADGNVERLPELAAQLVTHKADLIIAGGGNETALAARRATQTIPIIMTSSIGAVEAGLVQSLARPGGNVTGLTVPRELGFKQLQVMQELVPSLSRVAVLVRSDSSVANYRGQIKALAQQLLQVMIDLVELRSPDDLGQALETLRVLKPKALIVTSDPLLYQLREPILAFCRAARLPDMYSVPDVVDAGGLIAYSLNLNEVNAITARFVDRVLKGAKPADLPVEQPTRLELVINLSTARSMGLKVPQSLLSRADRLIE